MPGPFNPIDFGGLLGMWLALVPLWGPGIIFAGLRTKRTKAVRAVFSLEDIISLTLWAAIGNSLAITVRDELAAKSLAVLLAVVNPAADTRR